jgi:hypothetical protein
MINPEASIRVNVDVTNPGQFFACCGLLELTDRLWPGAEGWFEQQEFCIDSQGDLASLICSVSHAELRQLDLEDDTSSPMELGTPIRTIRLDWWQDEWAGGKELKVWAGSMESVRIARAMQHALRDKRFQTPQLLNVGVIVYDPDNNGKKVEPFYFDARRCSNAHSRDVGFSPNDLQMTTTAFPAVEFFSLIGLQRCLPVKTNQPRIFEYLTWSLPLPASLLPATVAGLVRDTKQLVYRFENRYRTGQRKHKSFGSAIPLSKRGKQ